MSGIELPPEWKWTTLGELATSVKNGIYVSRPSTEPNGIPILRIGAVRPMHLSLDDLRYTGMSLAELQRNDGLVRPGDLLFTRYSGNPRLVGACARVPDHSPIVAYPDKLIRVVLPAEEVDSRFISYAWISSEVQAQVRSLIKTTAGQTGISGSSLKSIRLPLPPLAEQRRIAQVLGHADAVRARRRMAIALLDELAQSIFLDMFGDIIDNDRGWPIGQVSDLVANFESGKSFAAGSEGEPGVRYRILKVSAVTTGQFLPTESKPVPPEYEPSASHIVQDGDLIFSRANTESLIGATALALSPPANLILPDKLWRFIWHDAASADPLYVRQLFRQQKFRREITRRSSGTSGSMKNISQSKVLSIKCGIPPLGLRRTYAERVKAIEILKEEHNSHLAELDSLFASTQHCAFHGELCDAPGRLTLRTVPHRPHQEGHHRE